MWYHISDPNGYVVKTGAGIETVAIKKKAVVWPFQKATKLSITPFDFSMSLQAMTSEKLQFSLPAVFTIGPDDNLEALTKYAVLLTGDSDGQIRTERKSGTVGTGRNHVQDIVKGIIEGETRSIVSNMTMEELFNNRRLFKSQVIECVQKELDQFGLRIYNANVKELQDLGDSKYFESLSRKAHEGAQSQAQVDVAAAQGKSKQEIAQINARTAVLETERRIEKGNADQKLKQREIAIARELKLEQIAADRAAEEKDAELQRGVEEKRAMMLLEKRRATEVTAARIAKESAQERADAEYYTAQQASNAQQYNEKAEAEAAFFRSAKQVEAQVYQRVQEADALLLSKTKEAEAMFITKEKEAEAQFLLKKREADGISALAGAYGELADVLGGPQGLMQYLMLQNGTYTALADANARALHGLQPKINVWTTGNGEGGAAGADAMAPIQNLFRALPPLFSTIQDQTGMTPPNWMANMPAQQQEGQAPAQTAANKKQALVNGH